MNVLRQVEFCQVVNFFYQSLMVIKSKREIFNAIQYKMPKLIDKYVLEDKIGAGQFGDVFKGFHQDTKEEVAIKTIRRETIKGKFYELLENEIKVLRTCDNLNIIKLHAIKKTANHFYLMLEYCNQGDMLARVRKHGRLEQEETIRFLCQILNAFQTLTKHKIMHRDFKLANILLHEGCIKIADFGFAKLLSNEDYATTMLGSPLNMAPEVLGGNKYNSKADIYSIGACVYEMLYGKPPYVAQNMVDLLKNIKSKPLSFLPDVRVNDSLKDVIKRMLVPDPKKRISWNDLFSHPINRYLDKQICRQINLQLPEDQSLLINTSKYYLKKNLVIDNASKIQENQHVNQYLRNVIKNGDKKEEYQIEEDEQSEKVKKDTTKKEEIKKEEQVKQSKKSEINMSLIARKNSKRILHYRNIYAFLASIADEIVNRNQNSGYEIAAYVMVRKILQKIQQLESLIQSQNCPFKNMDYWSQYCESPEYQQIRQYIANQYDVFNVFNKSLEPIIKQKTLQGQYDHDVKKLICGQFDNEIYIKYLTIYIKEMAKNTVASMLFKKQTESFRNDLKHIQCVLVSMEYDSVFGTQDFDFKGFHESFSTIPTRELLLRIQRMLKEIL